MLRRVHPRTVNPIPLGKQSWFDSKLLHQVDDLDIRLNALANVQSGVKPVSIPLPFSLKWRLISDRDPVAENR